METLEKLPIRLTVQDVIRHVPDVDDRELLETVLEKIRGGKLCLSKLSAEFSVPYATLYGRMNRALQAARELLLDNQTIRKLIESDSLLSTDAAVGPLNPVQQLLRLSKPENRKPR